MPPRDFPILRLLFLLIVLVHLHPVASFRANIVGGILRQESTTSTSSTMAESSSSLPTTALQSSNGNDSIENESTIPSRNNLSVGFLGCGVIASSIARGLVKACQEQASESMNPMNLNLRKLVVSKRSASKSQALAEELQSQVDISIADDNQAIVDACDVVFLCVLPQQAEEVLQSLRFDPNRHVLVSLVSTANLQDLVRDSKLGLERVAKMICLPCIAHHEGVALLCCGENRESNDENNAATTRSFLKDLFDATGGVVCLDSEADMEACMVTTCTMGPLYGTMQRQRDWLLHHTDSLSKQDATFLVIQQLAGAVSDATKDCRNPHRLEELIAEQTPGGLNEQALRNYGSVLGGFDQLQDPVMDAIWSRIRGETDGSLGGSTLEPSTSTSTTTSTTTTRTKNSADDDRGELRKRLFKIRTITAFVTFADSDFDGGAEVVKSKIDATAAALQAVQAQLEAGGYEVQTVRMATNPFPEYLLGKNYQNGGIDETVVAERLQILDDRLETHGIAFVSLGPAHCPETTKICTTIVGVASGRFSTSVQLPANDSILARAAAQTVLDNSKLGNPADGGLANFRFCVANLGPYVPFFPAAKADSHREDENFCIRFAIGLENGGLLKDLLTHDAGQTISKILPPRPSATPDSSSSFAAGFADTVRPLQTICERVAEHWGGDNDSSSSSLEYIGLDASFNPALDDEGSVASAVEVLQEVPRGFGGAGTIAATAAMTTAIQTRLSSQEDGFHILLTGYNGLMLPLCEDQRLAELATNGKLRMTDLLNVSSVCGVGIDTVPIPGDANVEELASLYLDVAGLAERWNKPLSCRVFPVPNKKVGDMTTFDSPFLVNSKILPIS